jgi:hypothetical protein
LKPCAILLKSDVELIEKKGIVHFVKLDRLMSSYFSNVKFAPTATLKAERGKTMAPSWHGIVMCVVEPRNHMVNWVS